MVEKIVFVKEGLITKRLINYEEDTKETICLEVTISKKIWDRIFAYRRPN